MKNSYLRNQSINEKFIPVTKLDTLMDKILTWLLQMRDRFLRSKEAMLYLAISVDGIQWVNSAYSNSTQIFHLDGSCLLFSSCLSLFNQTSFSSSDPSFFNSACFNISEIIVNVLPKPISSAVKKSKSMHISNIVYVATLADKNLTKSQCHVQKITNESLNVLHPE